MQRRVERVAAIVLIGVGAMAAPEGARGETLADAIALAYTGNPTLQQQRAEQRGLDESYVEAAAGLRPNAQLQLIPTYEDQHFGSFQLSQERLFNPFSPPQIRQETNTLVGQVVITQPFYTGGRVSANIAAAQSQIAAGRQQLRATEGDLLLNVVNAYTSVIRDADILKVTQDAEGALRHQLDEARARKNAGDATLTDVAQASAALENEVAVYASAEQQLEADRAFYFVVVGQNPGSLAPAPPLPNLPASVDEAFDRADANSPELRQAKLTEAASAAAIAAARAADMPNASLQASYGDNVTFPPFLHNITGVVTAQVVVTQPLYAGGLNASNVRRAVERNNADRIAVEATRRQVVENVANAWNAWLTAKANEETQERQVAAAQAAYDGMRVEYRAGLRSSFDVLFAEETLRDAQVLEIEAHHDAYFYAASVLRYTGSLEADIIAAGIATYDPVPHAKSVEHDMAPPWDPVMQFLDGLGAPGSLRPVITAPPLSRSPVIIPAAEPTVSTAALARNLPATPPPDTSAVKKHGSTSPGCAAKGALGQAADSKCEQPR